MWRLAVVDDSIAGVPLDDNDGSLKLCDFFSIRRMVALGVVAVVVVVVDVDPLADIAALMDVAMLMGSFDE